MIYVNNGLISITNFRINKFSKTKYFLGFSNHKTRIVEQIFFNVYLYCIYCMYFYLYFVYNILYNLNIILIFLMCSILSHYYFTSISDGVHDFNLYPASKHGSLALTHSVRRELAGIKAPIRITVSGLHIFTFLLFYFLMLFYINNNI